VRHRYPNLQPSQHRLLSLKFISCGLFPSTQIYLLECYFTLFYVVCQQLFKNFFVIFLKRKNIDETHTMKSVYAGFKSAAFLIIGGISSKMCKKVTNPMGCSV